MRYFLNSIFAATLLVCTGTPKTSAQKTQAHQIPQLNSCIREFYDPEMYKWLTFKNTCAQSVTIVYLPKDGSSGGTMDLRAGAKDSVGRSQGKVPKIGSFELYVCQLGYIPTDDSDAVVTKLGSNFSCKQKT